MLISKRIIQLVTRQVGRRYTSHGHGGDQSKATYNDLPSPSGSWQTHHDAQQRKYNIQLILAVATLAGTILFGKAMGLLRGYNYYPERPATIENYKECD